MKVHFIVEPTHEIFVLNCLFAQNIDFCLQSAFSSDFQKLFGDTEDN